MTPFALLSRLRRYGVALAATLIVVLALVLSAGRLLIQTLPRYQEAVAQQLSRQLGYPVAIDALQGRWHRFVPAIDARGIRVTAADGRPLLTARQLALELDLFGSLAAGAPVFRRLELVGLELGLRRSPAGWGLAGRATPAGGGGETAGNNPLAPLLAWLLQQRELRLTDTQLSLELEDGRRLPPRVINLGLQNRGDRHDLVARLELTTGSGLELRVRARGLPGEAGFEADLYGRIPRLALRDWRPLLPADSRLPVRLALGGELWGRWQDDRPVRLDGTLSVDDLAWGVDAAPLLSGFTSRLSLDLADPDRWRLQLNDLAGTLAGQPLATRALRLQGAGRTEFRLSLDRLDLARSHRRLAALPRLPERLRAALETLRPRGRLDNPALTVRLDDAGQPAEFQLEADLAGVGVDAWHGAPALRGVDGLLRADRHGGRVDFESHGLHLEFPDLYRQGWDFDWARGAVGWRLFDDRVTVSSERLQVRADGVNGNGRFSLEAPHGAPGSLTLMIGMDDSNGALAPLFVPDKVVSASLFDWLSSSIKRGHLRSGGFLYDGAFDGKSLPTAVQMFFDVDGAELQYQPEWPAIRDGRARVMVKDTALLVEVDGGRIYDDTRVEHARVRLPAHGSVLSVQGQLAGPAADGRRVLLEAPTRAQLGEAFAQWQLEGRARTALDLGIDLAAPERSRIRVESTLHQGRYHAPALDLDVTDLEGTLRYHETEGLSAERLTGVFFDQPVQVEIDSARESDGLHTRVNTRGRIDFARLNRWARQPILSTLSGSSAYRASLDICGATADCTRLTVWSDLAGTTVDLPGGLAKPAGLARPLLVRTNLGGDRQWIRVRYGTQLHTLLALVDQRLTGGEILFTPGPRAPRARPDGLWIRGYLPSVDPDAWQAFLDGLFPDAATARGDGRLHLDPLLRRVALRTDRLRLGSQVYESVAVDLAPDAGGWTLAVDSPLVRGRLTLPERASEPYAADLDYLHIGAAQMAQMEGDEPAPAGGDPLARFDPRTLPPLRLNVADLRLDGEDYGRWALRVEPSEEGVHISGIQGRIRQLDTQADLWWTRDGGGDHTQADLTLAAGNLKPVLEAWGATPFLDSESARLSGDFVWAGSPLNFDLASLNGELELTAKRGRFLETDAGGAVKLFGLLNLNAIGRRLRLDFSDVLKSGLSYDRIQGHYLVNLGVAVSAEPLVITGPSADLELEGTLNLAERTLDQRLQVTLPLSDNLPLTGALLGGPQVAGALFLVEKVIGKQLRKFSQARYLVYGNWEDPVVEPVRPDADKTSRPRSFPGDEK